MFGMRRNHSRLEAALPDLQEFQLPAADDSAEIRGEVARHLPLIQLLSTQVKGTAEQIEKAVVGVCSSFQHISEQARDGVSRATSFLSNRERGNAGVVSIEDLIGQSQATFDGLLDTLKMSAEISNQAIRRMQEIDRHAAKISDALKLLGEIANGNHILALNARIEAARAGEFGKGFEVVATEVVAQAGRSHTVITDVSRTIEELRKSAASALADLSSMSEQGIASAETERKQVEETLLAFNNVDREMRTMLEQASSDNGRLSEEIGKAVHEMQFQDRVNQRLDHVREALDDSYARLSTVCGEIGACDPVYMENLMSRYTMHEERSAASKTETEATGGDIELF